VLERYAERARGETGREGGREPDPERQRPGAQEKLERKVKSKRGEKKELRTWNLVNKRQVTKGTRRKGYPPLGRQVKRLGRKGRHGERKLEFVPFRRLGGGIKNPNQREIAALREGLEPWNVGGHLPIFKPLSFGRGKAGKK